MFTWLDRIETKYFVLTAWLQALAAMLGSLFFSDIMGLAPCKLCWYQRITMYPLVWILGYGYYKKDKQLVNYALPLVVVGWLTAAYHNLLYYDNMFNYGIVPDTIVKCQEGLSCTNVQLNWLGFVTIPLLSLAAYSLIGVCLWMVKNRQIQAK